MALPLVRRTGSPERLYASFQARLLLRAISPFGSAAPLVVDGRKSSSVSAQWTLENRKAAATIPQARLLHKATGPCGSNNNLGDPRTEMNKAASLRVCPSSEGWSDEQC